MKAIYVADTKTIGRGIFAGKDFRKNEPLFVVKGDLIRHHYEPLFSIQGQNWLAVGDGAWIQPQQDNLWNYINHSCQPNVGLQEGVVVTAMRDFSKGEEIGIDYAITEDDPFWSMVCQRQEYQCRGMIHSARFLSPELFAHYQPYMPFFLKESWRHYHPRHSELFR